MKPILVSPMVYVLELENDCFYIGTSYNINFRLAQHFSGDGSQWTKLHKPVKVVEVFYGDFCARQKEDEVTKQYMDIYGAECVRGGSWTRT
jgi:predicted GIY-YIG superfamily endonuclease